MIRVPLGGEKISVHPLVRTPVIFSDNRFSIATKQVARDISELISITFVSILAADVLLKNSILILVGSVVNAPIEIVYQSGVPWPGAGVGQGSTLSHAFAPVRRW